MPTGTGRGSRVTSADVARLAGVSRATVSYVLNQVPHQTIPEATRQRVTDAALELRYSASPAARALRTGRSDVVLGIVPEVGFRQVHSTFMAELSAVLARAGRTLVVHPLAGGVRALESVWRTLTPDAVIAFGSLAEEDVEVMRAAGIRVALVMTAGPLRQPWEFSIGDHAVGEVQAAHLLGLGHRQIGVALPPDPIALAITADRVETLRAAVSAVGGTFSVRVLDPSDPDDQLRAWRTDEPGMTAIAAADDDVAFAVVGAAQRLGLDVPGDLAVVGAFDHRLGTLCRPTLTTVRVDVRSRVQTVATALLDAVAGAELELPPAGRDTLTVVRRGST